jgi:glycine dehydrogenase
VHGDRNLVCSCPAPEEFESDTAEILEEVFA